MAERPAGARPRSIPSGGPRPRLGWRGFIPGCALLAIAALVIAACGPTVRDGRVATAALTPSRTAVTIETVAPTAASHGPPSQPPDLPVDGRPAVAIDETPTPEFDAWRRERVQRAVRNLRGLLAGRLGGSAGGEIAQADELPAAFAQAALCSTVRPHLELGSLDPLPQLLPWLGFAVGDLTTGSESALRRWVWEGVYLPGLNPIRAEFGLDKLGLNDLERGAESWSGASPSVRPALLARLAALEPLLTAAALFAGALEIDRGDVYRALLTAHNVLRESRADDRVQAALRPIRTDGGDDSGAYYHLFGMAAYAVAFELATSAASATGAQLAGLNPLAPEVAAALEEAFVADPTGDLTGDPTEFAVDLLGARVGRHLYAAFAGPYAAPTIPACPTSDSAGAG